MIFFLSSYFYKATAVGELELHRWFIKLNVVGSLLGVWLLFIFIKLYCIQHFSVLQTKPSGMSVYMFHLLGEMLPVFISLNICNCIKSRNKFKMDVCPFFKRTWLQTIWCPYIINFKALT